MSLFSKHDASSDDEHVTRQPLPSGFKDSPRDVRHKSIVQSDLVIQGDIKTTGFLEFSGKVTGNVSADTLIVHAGGYIKGNAAGNHVTTDGETIGSIKAGDVTLKKNSQTQADIICDRFAVETGAVIKGNLDVSAKGQS